MILRPLKTLFETNSDISGKTSVVQDGVERKLLVNGATQSILRIDGSERGYWLGMIPEQEIKSALLLGVAGGTIAKLLRKRWSEVRVVGYELDPVLVRVATSFFDLDSQLEVHVADARAAFEDPEKFEYIAVDLYSTWGYVPFAEELSFLKQIRDKLSPDGLVAFNRIPSSCHGEDLGYFADRLREVFSEVWIQEAEYNVIFWGRK